MSQVLRDVASLVISTEGGAEPPTFRLAERNSREFVDFRRVVYEDEVSFDDLDSSVAFADLLRRLDFVTSLPVEQRLTRGQANRLNAEGVARMSERRYDEALVALQQALRLRQEIKDQAGLITSFENLGIVYSDTGAYQTAIEEYRKGLALARTIGEDEKIGRLLAEIGVSQLMMGELDPAVSSLLEALEFQNRAGRLALADRTATLRKLGQIYGAVGDTDRALGYYRQTVEHCREGYDADGTRKVLQDVIDMAVEMLRRGRSVKATSTLQECIALSREAGDAHAEGAALRALAAVLAGTGRQQQARRSYEAARALYERLGSAEVLEELEEAMRRLLGGGDESPGKDLPAGERQMTATDEERQP